MSMVSAKAVIKELEPYSSENDKYLFEIYLKESKLKAIKDLISIIEKENGITLSHKLWRN